MHIATQVELEFCTLWTVGRRATWAVFPITIVLLYWKVIIPAYKLKWSSRDLEDGERMELTTVAGEENSEEEATMTTLHLLRQSRDNHKKETNILPVDAEEKKN